ncbi:30S ribosomal protein S2 [Candidatus Wolfebacteria bacterium]|nr:30S ribosomal protein S2 [Candidatus Wolfebacteria bacterium]
MDNQKIEEKVEGEMLTEAEILAGLPPERVLALQEMMRAGILYGHGKSRTNPKFRQYIHTTRNNIEIIDIPQTLDLLERAADILASSIKDGKMALVVATQPALHDIAEQFAKKFNFSFINDHWVGGLMTNFKVISGRIEFWKKLKADLASGRLDKYTKKERVMMQKNVDRMTRMFAGLENLTRLPDILFVIDTAIKGHKTAIREALKIKISIIGIIDNDDNPEMVTYPIPANDHSRMSVEWLLGRIDQRLTINNQPIDNDQGKQ